MTAFNDLAFFHDLLNSFTAPVLVADTGHIVRYANRAAVEFYSDGKSLIGCSLFACHNQQSQQQMAEIVLQMEHGLEEKLITDNLKHRIYMRAVRNKEGVLIGYYERFEPPRGG